MIALRPGLAQALAKDYFKTRLVEGFARLIPLPTFRPADKNPLLLARDAANPLLNGDEQFLWAERLL
jgi:hypothetical protein